MELINNEYEEWMQKFTPEELAQRIVKVATTSNPRIRSTISDFVRCRIITYEESRIPQVLVYARALYAYYPDRLPSWLCELLGEDDGAIGKLRQDCLRFIQK